MFGDPALGIGGLVLPEMSNEHGAWSMVTFNNSWHVCLEHNSTSNSYTMHWPSLDKLYLDPIRLETFGLRKHGPTLSLLEATNTGGYGMVHTGR